MDRQTDGRTNRQTDKASYSVAQLKTEYLPDTNTSLTKEDYERTAGEGGEEKK